MLIFSHRTYAAILRWVVCVCVCVVVYQTKLTARTATADLNRGEQTHHGTASMLIFIFLYLNIHRQEHTTRTLALYVAYASNVYRESGTSASLAKRDGKCGGWSMRICEHEPTEHGASTRHAYRELFFAPAFVARHSAFVSVYLMLGIASSAKHLIFRRRRAFRAKRF